MFTDEARREFIKRFEDFPDQVIAMAWAYAVGLIKFDVDLSKEWATVTDCANYVEGDICHICEFIPKQKTNADRIRSMTDEELAEWLERIRLCCSTDLCGRSCPLAEVCYSNAEEPKETLDWLKEEVDE